MRVPVAALTLLLTASLAAATEPQAVFVARAPQERLAQVLERFEAPAVVYRSVDANGRAEAVFIAADRPVEGTVVRRVAPLGEAPVSLYRVRFRVRYGALPLPQGDACPELDGPLGTDEALDALQKKACMDRVVREGLIKATDEEARKAAQAQLDSLLAAFSPASPTSAAPQPEWVSRRVRTYLVKTPTGERQEAEVEALLVALTWSRPFELDVFRPIEAQTIELLSPLRRAGARPAAGMVQGLGD
jgi:hypothetical protein